MSVIRQFLIGAQAVFFAACMEPSENRHQFKLSYKQSAQLTVVCHNCFYYFDSWDMPPDKIVIKRDIDGAALDLFSSIKFCGVGDTTADGWIRIVTDTGSTASFGVIFPDQELNQTLGIQSGHTGLGGGCSRKDQKKFEAFFSAYASKENLRDLN